MANIPGIKIVNDSKGNPKEAIIDLKKHGKIFKPVLESMGAIDDKEFEKEWKEAISGDELVKEVHKRIDKWWPKEK